MDKYLNEDAITAEIMSYVKNRIYNYAVLIDGDWGTGKTYFIQKSIIPTLEGLNSTPFVRQYDILFNKWGVLLCQKEYQTNDIRRNSREWL